MSVINKMLQDLDKRAAAQTRVEGSIRGAGIPLEPASSMVRWKIAAAAILVLLVLAAGWIAWLHHSGTSAGPTRSAQSTPVVQAPPQSADAHKKDAETERTPVAQQQVPVVAAAGLKTAEFFAQPSATPQESASKSAQITPPAQVTSQPAAVQKQRVETEDALVVQKRAPAVAATRPKAPVVLAQASAKAKESTSKAETPPSEVQQDGKPIERTDSAIAPAKKQPATAQAKTASKAQVPAADAKPSASVPAATTGQQAAPAQDSTKGSISVERQD